MFFRVASDPVVTHYEHILILIFDEQHLHTI